MATDVKKRLKGVPCFYHSGYIKCMTMVLLKKKKKKLFYDLNKQKIQEKTQEQTQKIQEKTQNQHDS